MDAESSSSARVLHLIRQVQVIAELLLASRRAEAKITVNVEAFVRNGAAPSRLLRRIALLANILGPLTRESAECRCRSPHTMHISVSLLCTRTPRS